MNYESVIGLEVHAQLLTRSKLFCSCSTEFGQAPNANTCPICLGLPGVLPVLNERVVDFTLRAGFATHCQIATKNIFARKNYFYPDLPKGYQISQYERPICTKGWVEIEIDEGPKRIGLTRIHIEEDAGKLLHEHPASRSKAASWVDLNRAGVPLIEIVSEPELRSPEEAVAYLKELRLILMYLDICDGNMEEGSLRCDANISVRRLGEEQFGTKVEIKNMNSFRHIEKALHYEIQRQTDLLGSGGRVVQETKLWDPEREETVSMRSKEEAHDYRYFPDPDLLPVEIGQEWLAQVKKGLPELPAPKRKRFSKDYQLPPADAEILTDTKTLADFFESCVRLYPQPKKVANWVINEFLRMVKGGDESVRSSRLTPSHVAKTLQMVDSGVLSMNMAKSVLQKVFETGQDPEQIVSSGGLSQVSDASALEGIIDQVIAENAKEVERFRGGETKLLSFFLGQVMKKTSGRANPQRVSELLGEKLK